MEQNQPQKHEANSIFFRRFLMGMLGFYLLFGSSVLAVWIVVRPRVPVFELHATVSNFSASNSTGKIGGAWELGFQIHNPNHKIWISYHNITSSIYYMDLHLANATVPPFDQDPRNRTLILASPSGSATASASDVLYLDGERNRGSAVSFSAKMTASVAFRLRGWRPRKRSLTVDCEDVPFHIPPNAASGMAVGGPQVCGVEF